MSEYKLAPVGRVKTVGGYPDESEHTVEWLCKYKDLKDGDLLYTAPQPTERQPAPDVTALLEALELISVTDPNEGVAWFHEIAYRALATYRKRQESSHEEY